MRAKVALRRASVGAAGVALWLVGALGEAKACGVSATGVASCSLSEHTEGTRRRFALGVSGAFTRTILRFDGSLRTEQTRYAALAQLAYLPTRALSLEAGLGAALAGSLSAPDGEHDFSPGPAASLGVGVRLVDEPRYFVRGSSVLSFAAGHTRLAAEPQVGYSAFDLRLGAEVGLNVANLFYPYLLGRAFGGPVFWQYAGTDVTGTDLHHYQVGVGAGLALGPRVSLLVEGVPLGEQSLAIGASLSL